MTTSNLTRSPPSAVFKSSTPVASAPARKALCLTLPLELLHMICGYLPYPAYLSLQFTCRQLYKGLYAAPQAPLPKRLDQCGRVALQTYLTPHPPNDTATNGPSKRQTLPQRQRCALCGELYPTHLFKSASSPACSAQDLSPARTTTDIHDHLSHRRPLDRDQAMLEMLERELAAATARTNRASARSDEVATERQQRHHHHRSNTITNKDPLATKRRGDPDWDVVELPQRICSWHVGRLTRVVRVEEENQQQRALNVKDMVSNSKEVMKTTITTTTAVAATNNTLDNGTNTASSVVEDVEPRAAGPSPSSSARGGKKPGTWVSRVEQMCTHCGAIQVWTPCQCQCQGCGLRTARTYTRYAEPGWSCTGYVFWRDERGGLWVRETVAVGGSSDGVYRTTCTMDVPVIFE